MDLTHLEKAEQLHHAYCVIGNTRDAQVDIERMLEKRGFQIRGNPDYVSIAYSVFGIDDARWIKRHQSKRLVSDAQVFILKAHTFTREAQNALLKTLEEPAEDTYFFIIVPNEDVLSPTLRSRMAIIETNHSNSVNEDRLAFGFLNMSLGERIQKLAAIIDSSDKENVLTFLADLEIVIHNHIILSRKETNTMSSLYLIYKTRRLIEGGRGNTKLLLENIALTL